MCSVSDATEPDDAIGEQGRRVAVGVRVSTRRTWGSRLVGDPGLRASGVIIEDHSDVVAGAPLCGLRPDREYTYAAIHDGAQPEFGSLRTAPRGRSRFTFTSFGDQGTPTTGKVFTPPPGVTLTNPPFVNDNLGSPAAGDVTAGVERVRPLFHLFNGDLCYANLATDRVRTWSDFWANNTRSARHRPWMPSAGNHENELGNGPIGYAAYQTYFSVPATDGQTPTTRGLWYAFTVGSEQDRP